MMLVIEINYDNGVGCCWGLVRVVRLDSSMISAQLLPPPRVQPPPTAIDEDWWRFLSLIPFFLYSTLFSLLFGCWLGWLLGVDVVDYGGAGVCVSVLRRLAVVYGCIGWI